MNAQVVEAQRLVHDLTGEWLGAPRIAIVPTNEHFPIKAPSDAIGMLLRGQAYIVANIPLELVAKTVAHEAVGHFAMRKMLKGKWSSFMLAIGSGAKHDDSLARLRNRVTTVYVDDKNECNLAAVSVGDEIAAIAAEMWFNVKTGKIEAEEPLKAQAAALAGHFAREALYMDIPMSRTQLQGALLSAHHLLRYGGPIFGLAWRFGRWYSPPMMKPMGAKVPPKSVAESERMLRGAQSDSDRWVNFRAALVLWPVFLLLVAALLGGVYAFTDFFTKFTDPLTAFIAAVVLVVVWVRLG